jgi:DNA mismatch endonuclease (patch repair protein)
MVLAMVLKKTTDSLSKEHRSWNMAQIKSKNTKPEIAVRKLLHRCGFRFRLHKKELPGKPDIVLPKWRVVIFVHGCFWHRHPNCKYAYLPKSNQDFWKNKFVDTVRRDQRNQNTLKALGWRTIVIWECELKKMQDFEKKILKEITATDHG